MPHVDMACAMRIGQPAVLRRDARAACQLASRMRAASSS